MNRAKKPIRRVTRPPTVPHLHIWKLMKLDPAPSRRRSFQAVFTPEKARQMLTEAEAPGRPNDAALKTAADYLNQLAAEIREPPPPRAEAIAEWAEETTTAALDLLRRFGVDRKTVVGADASYRLGGFGKFPNSPDAIMRSELLRWLGVDPKSVVADGFLLTPEARRNLREILFGGIGIGGPFADRVLRPGTARAVPRSDTIDFLIDALALLTMATDEAARTWRSYRKGAGANKKEATHKLAILGAAAYRAGTGKEPGLNPEGPFARFLSDIATKLGVNIEAGAAVAAWRREAKRNR
jgi:hypothetical protein